MSCPRVFVLTRTSRRPRAFTRLRRDLLAQEYDGEIIHVVHSDDPADAYATGDIIVHSERPQRTRARTCPWEQHNLTLLQVVLEDAREGFVTFIDDDDTYASHLSIRRMMTHAAPGVMPIWKVERENGRVSPTTWMGDLNSRDGRVCWEASTLHTTRIPLALQVGIDARDGADGRFWAALARHHELVWQDEILTRPQAGKGHGRRQDAP